MSTILTRPWRRAVALSVAVLVTTSLAGSAAASANPSVDTPASGRAHATVQKGPVDVPKVATKPLGKPSNVPAQPDGAAPPANVDPIDLKVLVLSADGTEADLPAIRQSLDYLGTPYQVFQAAPVPTDPTSNRFADPSSGVTLAEGALDTSVHAYYQAVVVATGTLGYSSGGSYVSALTPAEWAYLWAFEAKFGIRQLSWYTYPTPDYGFNYPSGAVDTTATPLSVPFTTAGATLFSSYANTATPVTIKNAYTYLAQPLSDGTTTPLLSDASGNALAAVHTYPDGRQALALTFDSNPYLLHNLVLSYGLVNWVTRGLFLGERHTYLSAQIDDVFIEDTEWTPTTPCGTPSSDASLPNYRMTSADLKVAKAWQATKRDQATTKALRLSMAFNGYGTTAAYYSDFKASNPGAQNNDTLTTAAKSQQAAFNWISHTYTHAQLDHISATDTQTELQSNDAVAQSLGLTRYSKANLVQPEVSGLANPDFLNPAYSFGVRNLVSDTSRGGFNENPSPNAGVNNAIQPRILQIPRRPNNLYFNVSTPAEWLSEDNCLYPAGAYGHIDTYDQLLERESNVLLTYMLKGDVDPWMFHQSNLRAYDGTHSLVSDLLDRTLAKYTSSFTLPVLSPTMDETGALTAARMQYNAAAVSAKIVPTPSGPASLTVTSQQAAIVPITGLASTGAEVYGGQSISHITLAPNSPQTFSAAGALSRTTLAFTKQQLATVSASKPVILTNQGSMQLAISSISTSGDFAQTNTCSASLAPGASCTIKVTFQPTVTGTRTGALTIVDSDPAGPQSVALSGVGMSISLVPTSLDFGSQLPLTSSAARTVTLSNADTTGTTPMVIRGMSITGPNANAFTQTNSCPPRLGPSTSCTISVTFRPLLPGPMNATLTVDQDVAGAPSTVTLAGTGG